MLTNLNILIWTGMTCLELFEPERHCLARASQAQGSRYTAHAYFWPVKSEASRRLKGYCKKLMTARPQRERFFGI